APGRGAGLIPESGDAGAWHRGTKCVPERRGGAWHRGTKSVPHLVFFQLPGDVFQVVRDLVNAVAEQEDRGRLAGDYFYFERFFFYIKSEVVAFVFWI